ncbi:uncharacterized protein [Apostichopus japonicus]|uniref:uncharacterized protein isoform X2 n=1 Tax=Stichopus japonicus TaxID=307972 RepID=UPI003AB4BF66
MSTTIIKVKPRIQIFVQDSEVLSTESMEVIVEVNFHIACIGFGHQSKVTLRSMSAYSQNLSTYHHEEGNGTGRIEIICDANGCHFDRWEYCEDTNVCEFETKYHLTVRCLRMSTKGKLSMIGNIIAFLSVES